MEELFAHSVFQIDETEPTFFDKICGCCEESRQAKLNGLMLEPYNVHKNFRVLKYIAPVVKEFNDISEYLDELAKE